MREGEHLVVQRNDAGGAQDGLAQPAHAEQQQQHADHDLQQEQWNAVEQGAEQQHDENEHREPRRRSEASRAPAAHGGRRARTMVSASTASTSELRNAADTAVAAVVQIIVVSHMTTVSFFAARVTPV